MSQALELVIADLQTRIAQQLATITRCHDSLKSQGERLGSLADDMAAICDMDISTQPGAEAMQKMQKLNQARLRDIGYCPVCYDFDCHCAQDFN